MLLYISNISLNVSGFLHFAWQTKPSHEFTRDSPQLHVHVHVVRNTPHTWWVGQVPPAVTLHIVIHHTPGESGRSLQPWLHIVIHHTPGESGRSLQPWLHILIHKPPGELGRSIHPAVTLVFNWGRTFENMYKLIPSNLLNVAINWFPGFFLHFLTCMPVLVLLDHLNGIWLK